MATPILSQYSKHALSFYFLILTTCFTKTVLSDVSIQKTSPNKYAWPCTSNSDVRTCNSYLYHIDQGQTVEQIAFFYNVQANQTQPIMRGINKDYLVSVSCSCGQLLDVDDELVIGYFHNTAYPVQAGNVFVNVSREIYSGQALMGKNESFIAGVPSPIHLLCGCLSDLSGNIYSKTKAGEVVVTYTVQESDTLAGIASLLSSTVDDIQRLNPILLRDIKFIDVGWVLFVPMGSAPTPQGRRRRRNRATIIVGIFTSVAVLVAGVVLLIFLYRRRKSNQLADDEEAKVMRKTISAKSMSVRSLQSHYLRGENMADLTGFESDRPLILGLEEVEEATAGFDETRKIGEGGYGSVYFGMIGDQEVAIKKMKSNKSKEFFAELKVLCKVHHINVVELKGFATGEDHLYLVYEFVRNGSLSEHLHDPLLKGHQPLSWNARAQIALDAARGIEYIHDHTKAQYVHRDIKTSNILLDDCLRAKVADFGLAKLVERSSEEDFIATRLVGTPGYLPPESVLELQTSAKTDVFAFGVVLAELITGQRALIRDNREPNKMKSLISIIYATFKDEDTEKALEAIIDGNLKGSYPIEEAYKMANVAMWCLSEDSANRPEMRDVVVKLSQIFMSSIEWEASLGGSSQIFSGVFSGR